MKVIDVNSDAVIDLTVKLEKVSKGAMPTAIRQTLNTLAFETKQGIPGAAREAFVVRNPGFWNAFSGVEMAKGFDVNAMKSVVGMKDSKRGGASEQAGRNMQQQQAGGTIGGRTFIPLDTARIGEDNKKPVRKENRLSNITRIIDTKQSKGRTKKQRFVKTSIYIAKTHGDNTVMQHTERGKTKLYRVRKGRGKIKIKTTEGTIGITPIYSVQEGREVDVSATPFVQKVALKKRKKTTSIFVKHANKQLQKIRK